MGTFWDARDPSRTPRDDSLPVASLAGGYISDTGEGIRPDRGPFPMTKGVDGIWVTDDSDPALAAFEAFDHKPYMYRVTRDDGSIVYRSDLYSRVRWAAESSTPRARGIAISSAS